MQIHAEAIKRHGPPYDVACLNCARKVAVLEPVRATWLRLQPPSYQDEVECELRAGILRCRRCGQRVFIEGLSMGAINGPAGPAVEPARLRRLSRIAKVPCSSRGPAVRFQQEWSKGHDLCTCLE